MSNGKPQTCELVLKGFHFPKTLSNSRANFRFIVDLRFVNDRGDFDDEHAVMPSLDTFWECDTNRPEKPNFVRDVRPSAQGAAHGSFDMRRIDGWDALILGVKAKGLHSIQFKVIDVDRADAWDWVKGILRGIMESLKYQVKKTVETTQTDDAEAKVVDKTLVTGSLGAAAADLRSFTLKRLARGGKVLYRGSTSFEHGEWKGRRFVPAGEANGEATGEGGDAAGTGNGGPPPTEWVIRGQGSEGEYEIGLAVRNATPALW